MALSETIEYDKITVSQPYAAVNVRKATVVKKDDESKGEEAKPKGFYVSVLNKMKYILANDLGHSRGAPKFPDSQIKLILKDLDKIDGFYDKWWRTESSQLEAFIRVVQNRRPDLSQRFIIDSVTRTLRG